MPVDIGLLLQNVQAALLNQQYQHAHFLLDYAIKLTRIYDASPSHSPHDVGIGLHRGNIRQDNEDCVLALQGTLSGTQDTFGLFIVCDGMGGHAYGQEAAHLALRTILEYLFPFFKNYSVLSNWKIILTNSILQANQAIYAQNQLIQDPPAQETPLRDRATSQMSMMGTTITATLLLGTVAYIANVGDSRTYLYTPEGGLRRLTRDHSVVAELLAKGILTEEEIYTHRQRNQITRALGTEATVEVDMFVVPLQQDATLLLCSDGLWEMTRDYKIERILSSPEASAASMANQLVQLANSGGGRDNIGGIVIQTQQITEKHKIVTDTLNSINTPTQSFSCL